ncbi:MAG: hypothetical protein AAGB11_10895 [Pseudomonadota bacterium]
MAPGRAKGFDRIMQGANASAAGLARGLGLHEERINNTIAISGVRNIMHQFKKY